LAALTVIKPDYSKGNLQLLETIAVTNAAANGTVTKAVPVPEWAVNAMFVLDITITGTTPLFDFNIKGVNVAAPSSASIPVNDADVFLLGSSWVGITQLTTDASTPVVTVTLGPNIPTDNTGSATDDCAYGVSTLLPPMLMYTYTYDGTTHDEDYNGTISVYWDRRSY
jgi:hypothetical protein